MATSVLLLERMKTNSLNFFFLKCCDEITETNLERKWHKLEIKKIQNPMTRRVFQLFHQR
jgi:hypothetical protein